MFFILFLLALIFLIAYFDKKEAGLESISPQKKLENIPENYLPPKLPWGLERGSAESDNFYPSTLPRKPKVVFVANISANVGGRLATAVVERDKIFLADSRGVYALRRDDGSLIWGVEIYLDNLYERKTSHPQPVEKWKALGLQKFVKTYGVGKHLYVATTSDKGEAYLLAFDKDTGDLMWKTALKPGGLPPTTDLVVTEGRVYVSSGGYIYCVSEDGLLLWRSEVETEARGLAYGGEMLFVTSSKKLYALDAKTGEVLWVFKHDNVLATPSYRREKIILSDLEGALLALSKDGKLLWKNHLGDGGLHLAVNTQNIFAAGRGVSIFTLDGEARGNFTTDGEEGGRPVASRDVVILPVARRGEGKIYLLWRGWAKLAEFIFDNQEVWTPTVSAAYGEIYVVPNPNQLYKLADVEKPQIAAVEAKLQNNTLVLYVKAYDEGSAIYKVLLAYSINNSPWGYIEMEIAKRYVTEPTGGYGLREEDYITAIEAQPGSTIEFYIVAIDNSGNYEISKNYAYRISQQ
ncbi:MAG: PQQ-binding-like beta-propeller repeat protein [Pyrobaculum sp.]